MICAACDAPTDVAPCAACGADPRLDGRYTLLEVLGQGAAGTTYLAEHDGRTVAIKESQLRRGDASKVRELVHREARVLRQLSHPQIPAYVEELWTESGRSASLFLVQDHVEGVDLQARLDSHRYTEDEVLEVMLDLCGILSYLHGLTPPVVHRDLKPANVIRRPDGTHVLVDFGSVRDALKDADFGGSTVAGTFGYMAPEQFAGDAEIRSDLYGLGALGVALLTRRDPATLQRHDRTVDWHGHATVTPGIQQLLDDLLALSPADRPASAAFTADRIAALLVDPGADDEPAPARRSAANPVPNSAPRLLEAGFADPIPPVAPEPFHQPPAARDATGLSSRAGMAKLAVLGVAMLTVLAVGLVLLITVFAVVSVSPEPVIVSSPPADMQPPDGPEQEEVRRLFAKEIAGSTNDHPKWPTVTEAELAMLPEEPHCSVTRTGGMVLVQKQDSCPAPLLAHTTQWANESWPDPDVETLTFDWTDRPPNYILLETESSVSLAEHEAPSRVVTAKSKEVEVRSRGKSPGFPAEVRQYENLANLSCDVAVDVGTDGRALGVGVSGCPAPFHQPIIDSFSTWTWEAPAEPVTWTTRINFNRY